MLPSQHILIADPCIIAIPIKDNQEPLVDLREQEVILYGDSPEIPNNTDYIKVRSTVYEKLMQAQASLPDGLRLCLYEGYRSLTLQEKLFNAMLERVQTEHPHWSQERIFRKATALVSPVTHLNGIKNIPPHATGGAVDVYLVDKSLQLVDMGMHPKDWLTEKFLVSETTSSLISPQARQNRQIMSRSLEAVGFVNYPTEFWHWSYGDRYWAYHTKAPYAIYGLV